MSNGPCIPALRIYFQVVNTNLRQNVKYLSMHCTNKMKIFQLLINVIYSVRDISECIINTTMTPPC